MKFSNNLGIRSESSQRLESFFDAYLTYHMLHMSSLSASIYHMTWIFYGYGLVQFGLLGFGLVTFGYFWSLIGYVWVFLAIFETIKWLILGSWENLQYLIPWICRKYFFLIQLNEMIITVKCHVFQNIVTYWIWEIIEPLLSKNYFAYTIW